MKQHNHLADISSDGRPHLGPEVAPRQFVAPIHNLHQQTPAFIPCAGNCARNAHVICDLPIQTLGNCNNYPTNGNLAGNMEALSQQLNVIASCGQPTCCGMAATARWVMVDLGQPTLLDTISFCAQTKDYCGVLLESSNDGQAFSMIDNSNYQLVDPTWSGPCKKINTLGGGIITQYLKFTTTGSGFQVFQIEASLTAVATTTAAAQFFGILHYVQSPKDCTNCLDSYLCQTFLQNEPAVESKYQYTLGADFSACNDTFFKSIVGVVRNSVTYKIYVVEAAQGSTVAQPIVSTTTIAATEAVWPPRMQ